MKKVAIILTAVLFLISGSFIKFLLIPHLGDNNNIFANEHTQEVFSYTLYETLEIEEIQQLRYQVYIEQIFLKGFNSFEEALQYANDYENAAILQSDSRRWVWDNYPLFNVMIDGSYKSFNTFTEAVNYAKKHENATVIHRPNQAVVWSNKKPLKNKVRLYVPNILQLPELPRGCEVTALAILLNYAGIDVDKMTLAHQVRKDPTPRHVVDGVIHSGNPHYGFVGDMFNSANHGYGVYNEPIFDLMQDYLPDASINLTGAEFEDILFFLNEGRPVWVITNATYRVLPDSAFVTWVTSAGEIQITYWLHAVVISGYDENYIYFSDPLGRRTHAPRDEFIAAWEQMGRQAISYAF